MRLMPIHLKNANKEKPALVQIGPFEKIEGLQAVPVKKGDRLPVNANGIITPEQLKKGERATLEDKIIKVTMPVKIKEAKGFKYKDTFKHKGIQTNPWAARLECGPDPVDGTQSGAHGRGIHRYVGV